MATQHAIPLYDDSFFSQLNKIVTHPDERTKDWPLMNLNHVVLASLIYLGAVFLGPYLMQGQKKLELKNIRIIHNFAMFALNLYMAGEILRQAAKTSWYGPIFRDERGLGMARALWLFYASKVLEFNDTFIMILRQSSGQISFLHVYHHLSVLWMWWFNVMYYPGGEAYPSAWLNSFVHIWMYGYYFLSTLGFNVWWKRYLTQLQISQLAMFVVQGVSLLFTGDPEFRVIGAVNGVYASTLLALFVNFYRQSYQTRARKDR